jgi:hypothetical protein
MLVYEKASGLSMREMKEESPSVEFFLQGKMRSECAVRAQCAYGHAAAYDQIQKQSGFRANREPDALFCATQLCCESNSIGCAAARQFLHSA